MATNSRPFVGTVRLIADLDSGLVKLTRGVAGSTLTADDADTIVAKAVETAKKHKLALDKWSFYVPEVNEKLAKDDKKLPVAAVEKAVKNGFKPFLRAVKWGQPRLNILPPVETKTKATSNIIEIA
jgi:hypothetical protein